MSLIKGDGWEGGREWTLEEGAMLLADKGCVSLMSLIR